VNKAVALALLAAVACGSHDPPAPENKVERQKRVIEPPAGKVRPLPPHAIRADGVGPYKLGATLAETLDQLPSGPRIATLEIPRVVHQSILRGEDDAILIGGEPQGRASFVAVVGGEVARTESGLHVGSTKDELVRALGAPLREPDRALDPRVIVPSGMRDSRIVLDGDRVAAIVVSAPESARDRMPDGCVRPDVDSKRFGICLSPAGETVAIEGDDLVVRLAESDKLLGTYHVPGLVFAGALRNPEGRDDLVAIARTDELQLRTWTLVAYRLERARLVLAVDPQPVYQLSAANARWIGADLRDIDMYLELRSRPDVIEVGGLLTTKSGDRFRDIAVISPVPVQRHRVKPGPTEAVDAGTSDAR
jgi:hypothetical protein